MNKNNFRHPRKYLKKSQIDKKSRKENKKRYSNKENISVKPRKRKTLKIISAKTYYFEDQLTDKIHVNYNKRSSNLRSIRTAKELPSFNEALIQQENRQKLDFSLKKNLDIQSTSRKFSQNGQASEEIQKETPLINSNINLKRNHKEYSNQYSNQLSTSQKAQNFHTLQFKKEHIKVHSDDDDESSDSPLKIHFASKKDLKIHQPSKKFFQQQSTKLISIKEIKEIPSRIEKNSNQSNKENKSNYQNYRYKKYKDSKLQYKQKKALKRRQQGCFFKTPSRQKVKTNQSEKLKYCELVFWRNFAPSKVFNCFRDKDLKIPRLLGNYIISKDQDDDVTTGDECLENAKEMCFLQLREGIKMNPRPKSYQPQGKKVNVQRKLQFLDDEDIEDSQKLLKNNKKKSENIKVRKADDKNVKIL